MKAPELCHEPYLHPVYDEPEFIVRNIWRLYGGWYDGNPARLKPAPDARLAQELAALAGGAERLAGEHESYRTGNHGSPATSHSSRAWPILGPTGPGNTRRGLRAPDGRGASTMARGVFAWTAAQSRRVLNGTRPRERAAHRGRSLRRCPGVPRGLPRAHRPAGPRSPGRAPGGGAGAVPLDQTGALPSGEEAVTEAGDALGDWTYPFMAAMAFLETSIPPVTLVVPGEWAVMLGGAMAGEGQVKICAPSARMAVLRRRRFRRLRARAPPGSPVRAQPRCAPGDDRGRLARLDDWLDRHGSAAVCLGRLIPLARPLGPFVTGASHFSYGRFVAWNALGSLLFTLLFCGSGDPFYRSYDEVAQALSRGALVLVAVIAAGGGTYLLVRRRRGLGAAAGKAAP